MMMRRRTTRKAPFLPRVFDDGVKEVKTDENLEDDERVTESDADCLVHRNRRQMLLASSTAAFAARASRINTNNIAAFAGSSEWASLNDGSAPGLASPPPSNSDPIIKKTERLGLKYELLASGSGDEEVERNDVVDVDYVMRRANGYFIYSNADCGIGCGNGDPERWAIADGFVDTVPEMVVGMKKGEVRKFLVKPEFGYASAPKILKPQPPEFGQRRQIEAHCTEPLLFEVRVVKIRKAR
jgi:FKBP-type peptidyl-prolyl cis-trans isomerase